MSSNASECRIRTLEYARGLVYIQIIGSIIYATQTRLDVLESLKRVLRYLKATAHYSLILGRKGANNVDLVGWTDSDWAQDPDTRRSIGAFIFDVAGSKIAWSSKKQPTVALSTVESEYMAMSNATKEAIWLRTLNQGCIALAHNPVNHSRAKHINIRHHFIRERIANNFLAKRLRGSVMHLEWENISARRVGVTNRRSGLRAYDSHM